MSTTNASVGVVQTKRRVFTANEQPQHECGPQAYVRKRKRKSEEQESNKKQKTKSIATPLLNPSPQVVESPALLAVRARLSERRSATRPSKIDEPDKRLLFSSSKVARGISQEELRKSQNSTYQALIGRQKAKDHSST